MGTVDDDLRLLAVSPCIDAGDTIVTLAMPILVDLDENVRVINDPDTIDTGITVFGLAVDMGAYEFQTAQPCNNGLVGDLNCDGIVNLLDLVLLALNFLETI